MFTTALASDGSQYVGYSTDDFFPFIDDVSLAELIRSASQIKYQSADLRSLLAVANLIVSFKSAIDRNHWIVSNGPSKNVKNLSVLELLVQSRKLDGVMSLELIQELRRVEKEYRYRLIEKQLLDVLASGKDYLENISELREHIDLAKLENLTNVSSSFVMHSSRNAALHGLVMRLVNIRRAVKCGDWHMIRRGLSDILALPIAPEAVEEVTTLSIVSKMNQKMHLDLNDGINTNKITGK
jgi:hypothetical protein